MANSLLSTKAEGSVIKINENGSPVEFIVCKHDYESELNGSGRTLVVRKDCYDNRQWHSSNVNAYATSAIDSWLNSTYKNLLDTDIREVIGTTKIKYTPGKGDNTVGTLERAIFLLSFTELGKAPSYANKEGTALSIASSLQIAYLNGSAAAQWTRSPFRNSREYACHLISDGNVDASYCASSYGSRPAFTLPSNVLVNDSGNVTPPVDLTAHKTLVNGTAYTVKSGKCMVGGTVYNILKGRTLIDGTGYDIKFQNGYTWVLNNSYTTPSGTLKEFDTPAFTSNGNKYSVLKIYGGEWIKPGIYYDNTRVNDGYGFTDEAYRTITFDEAPTGDLLAWLQANAVQQ